MILCVAEKPSVGREIAKVLGATTSRGGYMEGNGYWVSWTFGHLCTLQEPHDYTSDWKTWRLECLPMIPPTFRLKTIDQQSIRRQFDVVSDLMSKCESVINCGDAGQEGEVIQRWVMQKAACKVPVKRLWISALTENAIKEGFAKLYDSSDFDNLYAAGSARAIGDWLLGMNATRAYTLKYGVPGQVLSIGRVQTPTLALLVERQKAIDSFVPLKYWELRSLYRGGLFVCDKGKIATEEKAKKMCQTVADFPMEITKVTKKKSKEQPPKLFDLTLLQVECNRKFGFSADKTLQYIQSLYERKLTTYPRVDTNFLPNEIYGKVPSILQGLTPYLTFVQPILSGSKIRKSSKVFNDKKITDHHAIIPTGEWAAAATLQVDEKKVLDLIVRRFIAAFYPDCEISSTVVQSRVVVKAIENSKDASLEIEGSATVDSKEPKEPIATIEQIEPKEKTDQIEKETVYLFKATGKQILSAGWREILTIREASNKAENANKDLDKTSNEEDANEDAEDAILPEYKEGESGSHKPSVCARQTQAPRYMTEGDLLRAMETAGKQVESEELRDIMKDNGIGRPSTRAAIIETLIKRQYIRKEKKKIVPTPLGIALIDIIPNELLKSAELTGQWEKKLKLISDGGYKVQTFMSELKQMVSEVIMQVKQAERKILGEIQTLKD